MTGSLLSTVLALAAAPGLASAAYTLNRTYDHSNFETAFTFKQASDYMELMGKGDPTGGFVDYLSLENAKSANLFRVTDSKQVYLGVDNHTVYQTTDQGRASLRLEAVETFDRGLLIADIAHMPADECGVWPAFWSYNFAENPISEIDMIEGMGFQVNNAFSLHTCNACSFNWQSAPDTYLNERDLEQEQKQQEKQKREKHLGHHGRRYASAEADTSPAETSPLVRRAETNEEVATYMTGTRLRPYCALGGDCGQHPLNFGGCGATATTEANYGAALNKVGGGVYVLQVEPSAIKIWHFPRSKIPKDITAGEPDPDSWPLPMGAYEQAHGSCDIGSIFHNQKLIINTDFCGTGEKEVWPKEEKCAPRAATCEAFVAANPDKFSETYWLFNSIKLYNQ